MGRFGHFVLDADGHGGEPRGWRRRIPDALRSQMREYVAAMKQTPFAIDRFDTRLGIHALTHPLGAMQAVFHFTVGGILARFPKLRVGFMEAGVGWLPFWLERLDEHWELMPEQAPQIDRPPSQYFKGRCFLSMEPADKMVPYVGTAVGEDVICYASDYCHWDCAFPDSVKQIEARLELSDAYKRRIFADNAAKLYGIEIP